MDDIKLEANIGSNNSLTDPLSLSDMTNNELGMLSANNSMQGVVGDEKTPPKKRGRKAKVLTQSQTQTVSNSSANSDSMENATNLVILKRSQRRIKPTTKILENDELRYEYETKNIVRITSQAAMTSTDYEHTPLHQIVAANNDRTPSTSKHKSEKSDASFESGAAVHPTGSAAIKKKLFPKSKRDLEASGAALEAKKTSRKPCPDIEKFLSEVKAAKLNLNKSPDDKKLTKKQQRKLAKQKEKHLAKLGLRRNGSEEASDVNSSNDSEEFVPKMRVQVSKPSVTLRLRNNKESTPQPQAPPQNASSKSSRKNACKTIVERQKPASTGTKSEMSAKQQSLPHSPAPVVEIEPSQLQSLNAALIAAAAGTTGSTSVVAIVPTKTRQFICLCQKPSQYYTRNTPETSFCCAIDNIEEQKVGCSNQLNGDVLNLLRPSQRVGYMILCDDHKKRLRAHNCCAGCGTFCTQVGQVRVEILEPFY